ncbi:hypothetical protein FQA39_LY18945 [Lamprigera yunnana]|nr:hypothetical protein FQA39_LY03526 [Lamprigera yunnana]KAF5306211.1 hypothetical protein FQA39_LY18945 [Lamprigera yunnana]
MAGWDDDNFEPQGLGENDGLTSNKWEGEDEDDDVKDNWEDDEEEKTIEEKKLEEIVSVVEVKQKPKKKLQEKLKIEEQNLKVKEKEKEEEEDITPEEQMRRQKESDLKLALETTFIGSNKTLGVDSAQPTNKEDFQELAEMVAKNVQQFAKSEEYPIFAESLVRGVCAALNSFDLKKIKMTIDNMYLEKQKIEKGDKLKKNKGKGKAKLKLDGDNLNQYSAFVDDYDYEDFM